MYIFNLSQQNNSSQPINLIIFKSLIAIIQSIKIYKRSKAYIMSDKKKEIAIVPRIKVELSSEIKNEMQLEIFTFALNAMLYSNPEPFKAAIENSNSFTTEINKREASPTLFSLCEQLSFIEPKKVDKKTILSSADIMLSSYFIEGFKSCFSEDQINNRSFDLLLFDKEKLLNLISSNAILSALLSEACDKIISSKIAEMEVVFLKKNVFDDKAAINSGAFDFTKTYLNAMQSEVNKKLENNILKKALLETIKTSANERAVTVVKNAQALKSNKFKSILSDEQLFDTEEICASLEKISDQNPKATKLSNYIKSLGVFRKIKENSKLLSKLFSIIVDCKDELSSLKIISSDNISPFVELVDGVKAVSYRALLLYSHDFFMSNLINNNSDKIPEERIFSMAFSKAMSDIASFENSTIPSNDAIQNFNYAMSAIKEMAYLGHHGSKAYLASGFASITGNCQIISDFLSKKENQSLMTEIYKIMSVETYNISYGQKNSNVLNTLPNAATSQKILKSLTEKEPQQIMINPDPIMDVISINGNDAENKDSKGISVKREAYHSADGPEM